MKLVSFSSAEGIVHPGALLDGGDSLLDLAAAGFPDALAVIAAGLTTVSAGPTIPRASVRLHSPISNPPRVFAVRGVEFRDRGLE